MKHPYLGMILIATFCGFSWAIEPLSGPSSQQQEVQLQKAIQKETVDGDLQAAIEQYKKIISTRGVGRAVAARALLQLGSCYEKLGIADARKTFEQLLKDYGDQTEIAAQARARLAALAPSAAPAPAITGPTVRKLVGPALRCPSWTDLVSPDGKYFTCTGRNNLYLREVESGLEHKITTYSEESDEKNYINFPIWSADSKRIAYTHYTEGNHDLCFVSLEDRKPRVLYTLKDSPDDRSSLKPYWLTDGKTILVYLNPVEGDPSFLFISVGDGLTKSVPTAGIEGGYLYISPDGKYMAHISCNEGVLSANSTCIKLRRLEDFHLLSTITDPILHRLIGWSPSGDALLFTSNRGGSLGLWRQRVSEGKPEGEPELLKANIGAFYPLGIDRNGSIFYRASSSRQDVYVAAVDLQKGASVEAPKRIGQSTVGGDQSPAWSPDGKWLAYLCPQSTNEKYFPKTLCLWSLDSAQSRQVILDRRISTITKMTWPTDNKYLLACSSRPTPGLYRLSPETGETLKIDVVEPGTTSAWTPDGSVVFKRTGGFDAPNQQIVARDLKTGQEKEIYHSVEPCRLSMYFMPVSPDGRWLVFWRTVIKEGGLPDYTALLLASTSGGPAREILKRPGKVYFSTDGWSADSRSFYSLYYEIGSEENKKLQFSVEGGEPTEISLPLGEFGRSFSQLSFHPDGKHVAFVGTSKGSSELWVMENFLQPKPPVASAAPRKP